MPRTQPLLTSPQGGTAKPLTACQWPTPTALPRAQSATFRTILEHPPKLQNKPTRHSGSRPPPRLNCDKFPNEPNRATGRNRNQHLRAFEKTNPPLPFWQRRPDASRVDLQKRTHRVPGVLRRVVVPADCFSSTYGYDAGLSANLDRVSQWRTPS